MSRAALPLFACFAVAAATAQQPGRPPLDARAFTPVRCQGECLVDFRLLQEHGIYDAVRGSAVGAVLAMAEKQLGFPLAELDVLRCYLGETQPEGRRPGGLTVFQGSDKVRLPPRRGDLTPDRLGGYEALVEERAWDADDPDLWLEIRPGLLVYATRRLIAPLVEGKATPGVPDGEFLSLTSGKGGMAHFVVALNDQALAELPPLPAGVLQADDKPRFVMARLRLLPGGPDDEPDVLLEALVRHENGSKGPAALLSQAQRWLAAGARHPRLGALKRFWNAIELKVDGRDLTARLSLGKPRAAAGNIALMIAPIMWLWGSGSVATAAVGATVEDPAEGDPAPPEPPKPPPPPQPPTRRGQ